MQMQEPYPRAQSVMQIRSSSFQTTASRIFNKFRVGSKFRSISRTDSGATDKNPYMNMPRETRSMDIAAAKPYMSQPMLSMPGMPDRDDGNSTGSSESSFSRQPAFMQSALRSESRAPKTVDVAPNSQMKQKARPPTSSSIATITPEQPRFTASLPTSPTPPVRRPTVPRLTTLPGHRFSLINSENESASARLTPSVIIRQPAVPLNLPTIRVPSTPTEAEARARTISTSDNAGPSTFARRMSGIITGSPIPENRDVSRAQSRRHLRTMPALPMAGTDEPDDGDGDESDGGDGRDSDEEEDEDTDADGDDARSSVDSPNNAISPVTPSATLSPISLPQVDVSRIDLSFLKIDPKGKERAYDHNHDSSRTPTARTPRVGPSGPAALTHDYFSYSSGQGSRATTPRNIPSGGVAAKAPKAIELSVRTPPIPVPGRPGIYKQASRSMVDISGLGFGKKEATHVTTGGDGVLDNVSSIKKQPYSNTQTTSTPLPHDVSQPPPKTTLSSPQVERPPRAPPPSHRDALIVEERRDVRMGVPPPHLTQEQHLAHIQSPAPRPPPPTIVIQTPGAVAGPSAVPGSLVRRRSMPTFNVGSPPPPYPSFMIEYSHDQPIPLGPPPIHVHRHPQHQPPRVSPLPDEGCERLPPYSNDVLLRAIMPRKLEFTKPGIQAKDRKWRKVVCELEGTVFRVYRCPPAYAGTPKVVDWWERKVGVGDMSVGTGVGGAGGAGVGSVGGIGVAGTVGVGVGGGAGRNVSAEERAREQERLRAEKIAGETGDRGHTEIRLPVPPSPQPWSATNGRPSASSQRNRDRGDTEDGRNSISPPSRSKIVSLLKPPKSHKRAQSENTGGSGLTTPTPYSSRSSFNILTRTPSRPSISAESAISQTSGMTSYSNSNVSVSSPSSMSPPSGFSSVNGGGGGSSTRQSSAGPSPTHSPTSSISPGSNAAFSKGITCPPPQKTDLLKAYTLQHAESGLGNDYLKRKNVIRVRMEGEQFLLQARDVTDVVEWIEGLHSATNIALDLDERPMPRGPLFPRRRRRRPRRTNTDSDVQGTASVPV